MALDQNGESLSPKTQIQIAGYETTEYVISSDSKGGAILILEDETKKDLYLLKIDLSGRFISEGRKLPLRGDSPALYVDENDVVHLSWINDDNIYYAAFTPDATDEDITSLQVMHIQFGSRSLIKGPQISLGDDHAYIFWAFYKVSDEEAGQAHTEFVTVELNSQNVSLPVRLLISPKEKQVGDPYEVGSNLSQLFPPAPVGRSSHYTYFPSIPQARGNEIFLGLSVEQVSRFDELVQTAIAVFEDGDLMWQASIAAEIKRAARNGPHQGEGK